MASEQVLDTVGELVDACTIGERRARRPMRGREVPRARHDQLGQVAVRPASTVCAEYPQQPRQHDGTPLPAMLRTPSPVHARHDAVVATVIDLRDGGDPVELLARVFQVGKHVGATLEPTLPSKLVTTVLTTEQGDRQVQLGPFVVSSRMTASRNSLAKTAGLSPRSRHSASIRSAARDARFEINAFTTSRRA